MMGKGIEGKEEGKEESRGERKGREDGIGENKRLNTSFTKCRIGTEREERVRSEKKKELNKD